MTLPDSSAIDAAVVTKLGSDPTLLALCPNGVWWDEAPQGSTRFVIVSLVIEHDEDVFGGRAYEDSLYLVEARMLSTSGGDIRSAATRIDALLDGQPLTLGSPPAPVPGYGWMVTAREERTRLTEVDSADSAIRWWRRGGRYRVQMALT